MVNEDIVAEVIVVQTVMITAPDINAPIVRTPAGVQEHWCEHKGCNKWGSFGFDSRSGPVWFCGEHRWDGER